MGRIQSHTSMYEDEDEEKHKLPARTSSLQVRTPSRNGSPPGTSFLQGRVLDNVPTVVIQQAIINQLPGMFSPAAVFAMDAAMVRKVAAESDSKRLLRAEFRHLSRSACQGMAQGKLEGELPLGFGDEQGLVSVPTSHEAKSSQEVLSPSRL